MSFALLNPPHGSSFVCGCRVPLLSTPQPQPTAAVLGSPANSLGSPLSQFLGQHAKPPRDQKHAPKPQCRHHCQPASFVGLYLAGLGRTRGRRAPTASANRCVNSTICSRSPVACCRHFFLSRRYQRINITLKEKQQGYIRINQEILSVNRNLLNKPSPKKSAF
jgi:hypothetical protein